MVWKMYLLSNMAKFLGCNHWLILVINCFTEDVQDQNLPLSILNQLEEQVVVSTFFRFTPIL